MIPLSRPDITEKERKAVQDVLQTAILSLGPKRIEFGELLAAVAHRKHGIAVNSGTAALHGIVRALGIREGDEVITSSFSFIASSNCILYERARPVFCDINAETLTIDPTYIERSITPRTKAILAVDVFGHPADWDALEDIAKRHNLKLIEDSAESLGSEYKGRRCGSFGDAAIFSFYPNKQITTGEGGAVVTDSEELADFMESMVNQGRRPREGKWFEHVRLGFNYRLPEIPCALGIEQLKRLEEIMEKRSRVASLYGQKLASVSGVEVPFVAPWATMSWFVYVIRLARGCGADQRDRVVRVMAEKGVQCGTYFSPIHLQPPYKELFGYRGGELPVTEDISCRTIALPFFNALSEQDVDTVVATLKQAMHDVF